MMQVFTTVYRDAELLPHFIRHYRSIGCTGIHILVNTNGLSEASREIIQCHSEYVVRTYAAEYSARHRTALEMEAKSHILGGGKFYAAPDLDELYQLPMQLSCLDSEMEPYDFIGGNFVDRIAADGSLPSIDSADLWATFPVDCHLTKDVLRGYDAKVMCIRSEFELDVGKHYPAQPNLRRYPQAGTVYHFKWHAGVLDRLRERTQLLRRQGYSWFDESDRLLEHVARYGKIELRAVRDAPLSSDKLKSVDGAIFDRAPSNRARTVAVIGAEGAGTRAMATAVAKLTRLPFFDFHDWHFRLKKISLPAVMHISLPNGRPKDIMTRSCPNLASVAWVDRRVLRSIDHSLKVVFVTRRSRDAIYSAFRRLFSREFLATCPVGPSSQLESIELAIVFHYLAIARQADLRRSTDSIEVSYEHAVATPHLVFSQIRDFLGFGAPISDYGLRVVQSSWDSDPTVAAAFDRCGVP